MIKNSLLFW